MRISDWSSDVCFRSPDLRRLGALAGFGVGFPELRRLRDEFRIERDNDVDRPLNRGFKLLARQLAARALELVDRKSVVSGKSVSVRVDLGGRRIFKTQKHDSIIKHQKPIS